MKVLWLCNTVADEVREAFRIRSAKPESWISALLDTFKEKEDFELIYMFSENRSKQKINWVKGKRHYISYPEKNMSQYSKKQQLFFADVLNREKPDIIHIFGSEFPHCLSMVNAAEMVGLLGRVVIGIQGMPSVIAKHYENGLSYPTIHKKTFFDFFRGRSIRGQKKLFYHRGQYEIEAITKVQHVIGRTDWDYACTRHINDKSTYHFCNETLRASFYDNSVLERDIEPYSVFVSQCQYPIKGFHYMLSAMADVVQKYPKAHLYTTGISPFAYKGLGRLRQTYYNRYLGKLIRKHQLQDHITFLGTLDELQMKDRYTKSNVFVCCSTIENSSNSVGEAMIVGVPIVASDVGGIKNLVRHNCEGLLYPSDAPYMLSHYICTLFADKKQCDMFSQAARLRAHEIFDVHKNFETLLEIYNCIAEESAER